MDKMMKIKKARTMPLKKWEQLNNKKMSNCRKDNKSYVCSKCNFCSAYSGNLAQHVKRMHEKTLNFSCIKCNFMARSAVELNLHTRAKHEGIRDYICQICGHAFGLKSTLKTHMRGVHYTVRKCVWCPFSTTDSKEMKHHKKITKCR